MRLLHRDAQGTYHLKEIADALEERYAILSHRWYPDGDILYADFANQHQPGTREKQGWRKLQYAVDQAERDGYRYVWIDTCCIDKTSSAELSEAINSMFFWYQRAQVCYAYLWDMSSECPPLSDARVPGEEGEGKVTSDGDRDGQATDAASESDVLQQWRVTFTECSWFTRGWTLQELIAPREVRFFGVDWNPLGSSHQLVDTIAARTLIDADLLRGRRKLKQYSIAQRMSWAADRVTSRIEDRAYSLLGLFDVNIPLLYGERDKAFMRLQEEIIRRSNDQSILAWGKGMAVDENPGTLLARSPSDFRGSSTIVFRETFSGGKALQLDNRTLRGSFLVGYEGDGLWTAKLNCEDLEGNRIKLSIVKWGDPKDRERHSVKESSIVDLTELTWKSRRLRPLGNSTMVAVARSGRGFCSRISSSQALPTRGQRPADAWRALDKNGNVKEELAKLRIVLSRREENFYCGPLKMSARACKENDRDLLEVSSPDPQGRIPATNSLPHDSLITRFTYNDTATLLVYIKNLNEMLDVSCTAQNATWMDEKGEYSCAGSLIVHRGVTSIHDAAGDNSPSARAWRFYNLWPRYRFSGHSASSTFPLQRGWKLSTRMSIVGRVEPEVQLLFELLPPPTSRMGKMGGIKRLLGDSDRTVQFEAA
ncbi:hypothetical protein KC349_g4003 [Hortaea werneckii]|nr:hypothetical protein KC349_g4003 [Hortaea werneckii]